MAKNWRERLQWLLGKTEDGSEQKVWQTERPHVAEEREKEEELKIAIEKTRRELLSSRSFFDNVLDPDMIDHAIYALQATEKKYTYLLKDARGKGLQLSINETLRKNIMRAEDDNGN